MAPRANSTGQISPPMAERQTGSDRFPELGAFVSNHKGLITFDANTEEDGRKNASWSQRRRKETQESRPL